MNTQLTIVASIFVKEAHREFVKSELIKLIAPTLKEKGCMNYDLHQDNENPNHFMFYENWESWDLWQDHMKTEHIEAYMKTTDGMVDQFTLNEMTLNK